MTGLRELEEQMDQYDQDRKRLVWLLGNANEMLADCVKECCELRSEIARYKEEAKR